MCGIAGLFAPHLGPGELHTTLETMVSALHHRGPDDRGCYQSGPFGFGMTRLSIIDVAGGRQPIASEDGHVHLVCNGEIYNHAALREQLLAKGHRFRTGSDVEVILHLYEDVGIDCVHSLEGMFGFALWDERRQQLLLARDHLGIKPLCYAMADGGIAFASEMKSITRVGYVPLDIDEHAIDQYLTIGYVPAPLSIYQRIKKLPAAHRLVWRDGQARVDRYWSLPTGPAIDGDDAELESRFMELFHRAVDSHLMSEVPLGAFLSGGLDSSVMVAVMSTCTSRPINTFTVGFGGHVGSDFDERQSARAVSERYGTVHTEIELQPKVDDVLEHVLDAFDEPFADDSVIPSFYVSQLARRHVTVALTGLGGDELLAGYERYLGLSVSQSYEHAPAFLRTSIFNPLIQRLPEWNDGHYTINRLKRFARSSTMSPSRRYLDYLTVMTPQLKTQLLRRPLDGDGEFADAFCRDFEAAPDSSMLQRVLHSDIRQHLPEDILMLTDRLSMCHGLELRVPFLDRSLVEFCSSLPDRMKIRGLRKKYLLRKVAQPLLPPEVLNRRKQGFASPMSSWLRHDLKGYFQGALSRDRLNRHGYFNPETVDLMLAEHTDRRQSHDRSLFALLMLQKWLDRQG